MFEKIKNILIINSGGGFGDTVQYIPLLNWINENYPNIKLYYYANDYENYYFENSLKGLINDNIKIIKNFPIYFGFRLNHYFKSKKLAKNNNLKYFDLIIDNQTKLRNLLIYKNIPHKYFFSPTFNYFFCNPKIKNNYKSKGLIARVVKFLEIMTNKNIELNYTINIHHKFIKKSDSLLPNNEKYFGLSLVAGHKTRKKQFNKIQIIKTINYFAEKYLPVFFIQENNKDMINLIKENIPNAIFPEHNVETEFKSPELLVALADKMDFNISIDNGVAHLLALSKSKTFCFYPGNAEKFKPLRNNFFSYNCDNYDAMDKITSDEIIKFIEAKL